MEPNVLLNDAVTIPMIPPHIVQVPIIKGDAKSVSIAAASIVAKVTRDVYKRQVQEDDEAASEFNGRQRW